jgi:mono/diheme cytochrome c family protein
MFAPEAARPGATALATLAVLGVLLLASPAAGDQPGAPSTGAQELYQTVCATCHGPDGRGIEPSRLGFDTPLPDFTDCSFATPEPDLDWLAVTHGGGPARGFDPRMPAFGEGLSDPELKAIVAYMRGFCTDTAWPRGELNLPRALVTEKAFPENEAVLTTTIATSGEGHVGNELLYERRLGARSQFEIVVPLLAQETGPGWEQGIGDVALALKHVLFHSLAGGRIVSLVGEVVLPTGNESRGLGKGVTVLEPFVAFGQMLPADGFVQVQAGFELPVDTDRAEQEAFWRTAVGKTFTEGRFGRAWSPMIEVLAARAFEEEARVHWDLVPQVQVTLNRRQHLMINVGVRFPVNDREGRSTQLITYFLWDWFDGGLLDGW